MQVKPALAPTGEVRIVASSHSQEAVWSRFEALIEAHGAPSMQQGREPSPVRLTPRTADRGLTAPQPSVEPHSQSLVATPCEAETVSGAAEGPCVAAGGDSPAHPAHSAWFYRFQGAALTGVMALAVLVAARTGNAPLAEPAVAPAVAATADSSAAFADAFAQTARVEAAAAAPFVASPATVAALGAETPLNGAVSITDAPEAEVIARITAADPPYKVVLHIAQDASPRDVARLDTAIKAWGFSAPEQRVATEAVTLPEVAFHAGRDREAALIVARIADSILAEAVLTPPAAPMADTDSAHSGLIDVYVTTR